MSQAGDPSEVTNGRCAAGSYVGSKCGQVGVWMKLSDRPIAATAYTLSNGATFEFVDVDWTFVLADPIHFGPVRNSSGSVTHFCQSKIVGTCNLEITPTVGAVTKHFAYIYATANQTGGVFVDLSNEVSFIVSTLLYECAWFRRVMSVPAGKESFLSHLKRNAWLALQNTQESAHATADTGALKHFEGNDALTADLNPAYKNDDGSDVLVNAVLTEVTGFDCAGRGEKCMPGAYTGVRHKVIVSGLSSVCSTFQNIGAQVDDDLEFEFDLAEPCALIDSTGDVLHGFSVTGRALADCGAGYNATPNAPTATVAVDVLYSPYYTLGLDRPVEVVVTINFYDNNVSLVETVTEYFGFNLLLSSGLEIDTKTAGSLSVEIQLA